MDTTTLIGICLGLGAVLGGQLLEGGHPSALVQLTAGVIVFGGTFGAVVTQFPRRELELALGQVKRIFRREDPGLEVLAERLTRLARQARRDGLVSLERLVADTPEPFLRRAVSSLVDGCETSELRSILEQIADQEAQQQQAGPRFFEAAGGYAPTIGILGAVLGLIHVMSSLADPDRIGSGIAVAFVATVYGVGSANLVFLPLAGKLKLKIACELRRKDMIIEGVCAIQEGLNPVMLSRRLVGFIDPPEPAQSGANSAGGIRAGAPRSAGT